MRPRSLQDWQMWGPIERPHRTTSQSVFYFMFVHRKVILHKAKTNGRVGEGGEGGGRRRGKKRIS